MTLTVKRKLFMRILINGGEIEVETRDLRSVLIAAEIDPDSVLVAVNGDVSAPADLAEISLSDGDKLEVMRIVGGG